MNVNIRELLNDCGIEEQIYPGKRHVHKLAQPGENKSHSVVFDWRTPDTLRVDVKAGLSGHTLSVKDLKKYPVSFQSENGFEISIDASTGKKSQKALDAFSEGVEGKTPEAGKVKKLVLMGKEMTEDTHESALSTLTTQIKDGTVAPVNVLASAKSSDVTVATPSGGLTAKGTETVPYSYKGNEMFGVTHG